MPASHTTPNSRTAAMASPMSPSLPAYFLDGHDAAGNQDMAAFITPGQDVSAPLLPPHKSHANVVPLSLLQRWPATVECPACKEIISTRTKHEAGKGTHALAVFFFFFGALGTFIPYVCNAMQDVRHDCTRCGKTLATCHFGSTTEAHLF